VSCFRAVLKVSAQLPSVKRPSVIMSDDEPGDRRLLFCEKVHKMSRSLDEALEFPLYTTDGQAYCQRQTFLGKHVLHVYDICYLSGPVTSQRESPCYYAFDVYDVLHGFAYSLYACVTRVSTSLSV